MARTTPRRKVFAAADVVEDGGVEIAGGLVGDGIEQHAVDGEVAAEDVFARVGGVADGIGTAAVGVGAVRAEGGDFGGDLVAVDLLADQHYAEVCADGEGLREERDDLVRGGGRGDVVILGCDAEEEVANAAAGEEGLVAGAAEGTGDGAGCTVLRG